MKTAPEAPDFKPLDQGNLWFARRVATRARGNMRFVEALQFVARPAGVPISYKSRFLSVDVVPVEEGSQIITNNPDLHMGKVFRKLVEFRNRSHSYHLGNFVTVRLGEVKAHQMTDDVAHIGAEVVDPEPLLRDRKELAQMLEVIGGNPLGVAENGTFYVDYAAYNPAHSDGIEKVIDYANEWSPETTDLFEVAMFHPEVARQLATSNS